MAKDPYVQILRRLGSGSVEKLDMIRRRKAFDPRQGEDLMSRSPYFFPAALKRLFDDDSYTC